MVIADTCVIQVASLDDVKTNSQTDTNAAKTMALDHLGVIAARIRTSIMKVQKSPPSGKCIKPLDEVSLLQTPYVHVSNVGLLDRHENQFEVFESVLGCSFGSSRASIEASV